MIEEMKPQYPNILFATFVESKSGEEYMVVTMLLDLFSYAINRSLELENDINTENPDGRFQTQAMRVVNKENVGKFAQPSDVVAGKKSTFGREAVMTHDRLVEELENDTYDPTQDPYYQFSQLMKLKTELDQIESIPEDLDKED